MPNSVASTQGQPSATCTLTKQANLKASAASTAAVQTSDTHPLKVSWVALLESGRLGLCQCPGQTYKNKHVRDLNKDLQRLVNHHGGHVVVCLLNDAELRSLGLRDYQQQVAQAGLQLIQYPIIEMAPPDSLEAAADVIEQIVALMKSGKSVVMHCRGGVGRAGLMAACVLLRIKEAESAQDAIKIVRWRRCPAAIETTRQEEFVSTYEKHLRATRTDNDIGNEDDQDDEQTA